MTIVEYLTNDDRTYRYVGTIWGTESMEATGDAFARMVADMDYDGPCVESLNSDGFQCWRSGMVTYRGTLIEETVLELVD